MLERFWSYVDRTDTSGCWTWTGTCNNSGYGKFWMLGRTIGAHRVAYELEIGPIPANMFVCHTCDNPPCVNPTHLFLGTHADNMADCKRKGRTATKPRGPRLDIRGDRHWTKQHPESILRGDQHPARLHPELLARGEGTGHARLTESDVKAIRTRYRARVITEQMLADEYGVSVVTINRVRRRVTWKHVP